MGLVASVACTCYITGRATPPPVPHDRIGMVQGYPELRGADLDPEIWLTFDTWREHACAHPGMNEASARIGQYSSVGAFRDTLAEIGWAHFPVLQAELLTSSGSATSASAARAALHELTYFAAHVTEAMMTVLVDTDTGALVERFVSPYLGHVYWRSATQQVEIGLDHDGLYIYRSFDPPYPAAHLRRIEQHLLEPERIEASGVGQVQYTDLDTGETFIRTTAITRDAVPYDGRVVRRSCAEYPRRMQVERRPLDAAVFAFLVEPLTIVFKAAAETGNPVCWL